MEEIVYISECGHKPYQHILNLNSDNIFNYNLPFQLYDLYKYPNNDWNITLESWGDFYIEIRKTPIENMTKERFCKRAMFFFHNLTSKCNYENIEPNHINQKYIYPSSFTQLLNMCDIKVILSNNNYHWLVDDDNYLNNLFQSNSENLKKCEMLNNDGNQINCYFELNNYHWAILVGTS